MRPADYAARLHAHLDARRDPLDDPEVCAFLDAHPEQLAAFADLRAALATLPAVVPAMPPSAAHAATAPARSLPWLPAFVAASLALVAFTAPHRAAAPTWPTLSGGGRVLAAELRPLRHGLPDAVRATARQTWIAREGARLETFTTWTVP